APLPRRGAGIVVLQLLRQQLAPPHECCRSRHESRHQRERERFPEKRKALTTADPALSRGASRFVRVRRGLLASVARVTHPNLLRMSPTSPPPPPPRAPSSLGSSGAWWPASRARIGTSNRGLGASSPPGPWRLFAG